MTTVYTHEVLVVRGHGTPTESWCAVCARLVRMLTVEESVDLAGVTSRTIHRLVEDGRVHFSETPGGLLLVCRNSLLSLGLEP